MSDKLTGRLLDEVVDLMFRIYLIRGDCSTAAQALLARNNRDHAVLDNAAHLDEALARVYRTLQTTVRQIQHSRASKRRRRTCD